jgi:hypothetical protein
MAPTVSIPTSTIQLVRRAISSFAILLCAFSFLCKPANAQASQDLFPGVKPVPIGRTPLAAPPSVISLQRLDQSQMSDADYQVVSNLSPELSKQAALVNFDISDPGWHFQQIVCPAFPDYVLLSFSHGPDESGSSRFGAVLPRRDSQVRVVSTYAHGLLPFQASWNRPGTFEVFNQMLSQQRGDLPLSRAPNWLMIALCYAELSGYPVQVLSTTPLPDPTLDMQRLGANRPQMVIAPDQSAVVQFSDVSHPAVTTNWKVSFNQHGQITAASRSQSPQSEKIALKP